MMGLVELLDLLKVLVAFWLVFIIVFLTTPINPVVWFGGLLAFPFIKLFRRISDTKNEDDTDLSISILIGVFLTTLYVLWFFYTKQEGPLFLPDTNPECTEIDNIGGSTSVYCD